MPQKPLVQLGFTPSQVHAGAHICMVYTSEKERKEVLTKFIKSGLEADENVACFSDQVLKEHQTKLRKGQFTQASPQKSYFHGGIFDPDRMLHKLLDFYTSSHAQGCQCRVIGEMLPEINEIEGGEKLIEYEASVNDFLVDHPVTTICQYNAREFCGDTIMELLKVHPKMLLDGAVIENPFFIPPKKLKEDFSPD
jgi:hypothetical protein